MKNTARNRRLIERQLTKSPDVQLRTFVQSSQIKPSILANLLVDHLDNTRARIRYLKGGVSGAGVLLLIPEEGIAKVVKFGPRRQIASEYKGFKKYIEGRLSPHVAAFSPSNKLTILDTRWASFCYWWAGGEENVRQIDELLADSAVPSGALIDPLEELMTVLFRWSRPFPKKTADPPSTMMRWHRETEQRIRYALKQSFHLDAPALLRFLDGDCEWFSKLGIRKFSVSVRCHGDINYRNVVFSGNKPSRFRLCLIDFGSVKRNISPAYDWSKLERDIHFKCVCELWHEPDILKEVLVAIDTCMASGSLSAIDVLPASVDRGRVRTIIALISSIRDKYIRLATPFSDLPLTEYLWFLVYRWLTLLDANRYPNHDGATRTAIITAAASIYAALQKSLVDDSLSQVPAGILKALAQIDSPANLSSGLDLSRSQFDQSCMSFAVHAARQSEDEDDDPHPQVGVVVAKQREIIAVSHRGDTGLGDHAEFGVLEKMLAHESLAGATVFTTLEPCTIRKHEEFSCAQHLIDRRIARVVIGMRDPAPHRRGKGILLLKRAGVEVEMFPKPFVNELFDLNRVFIRSRQIGEGPSERGNLERGARPPDNPKTVIDFLGTWYGAWHRADGTSGKEVIHILTQHGNTLEGTFFDIEFPETPVLFEGTFRHPYLRVHVRPPYAYSKGKGIMEDGSCFVKLQDDGSFTGFYASFNYYGEYTLSRA